MVGAVLFSQMTSSNPTPCLCHYGERWREERQADRGPLSVRAARAALLRPSSTPEGSPGFYVPPSDWTPGRSERLGRESYFVNSLLDSLNSQFRFAFAKLPRRAFFNLQDFRSTNLMKTYYLCHLFPFS